MLRLKIEIEIPQEKRFVEIGEVKLGDKDGSVSDNQDNGERDVYIFGVDPIEGCGYLKRSRMGIDAEMAGYRQVTDLEGFESVASIEPGASFDFEVTTDVSSGPRKVRLRCLDD